MTIFTAKDCSYLIFLKIVDQKKSQGHKGHRKIKCEISQAFVVINFYVKFNVHCSYAEQAESGGQTDAPGDDNRHPP